MTQMNGDSHAPDADREFRKHLRRTLWSFALIYLFGIGLGFFLFRPKTFNLQVIEYRFWIFFLTTGILYWFVAFTSRALHFRLAWRIIGSLAFSIAAAYFTLLHIYLMATVFALISGKGT